MSRAVPGRRIFSAAIVAFIIYTMTLGKIREIAVLKLIGTRNRTIAGIILQQALGLGLIGPSGSGKSTLLKCLGAVIEPSGGKMVLGGETIYDDGWKIPDLRTLRRDSIGFVFQAPYLIPFLDVTDNVALLPMLAGQPNAQARDRARELLAALDVAHRAQAQPSELSGGEQQRVSIARALANRPPVILADEPTAPLDHPDLQAAVSDPRWQHARGGW